MVKNTETVEDAIRSWDLNVPYLEFRKSLRQIAEQSWPENPFNQIIQWSDRSAVEEVEAGSWLVPMDEDDWLAPRMVETVQEMAAKTEKNVITWKVHRLASDGKQIEKNFVESCGYALKLPYDWQAITNHMLINGKSSEHITEVLAIRNETVASVGFLSTFKGQLRSHVESSLKPDVVVPSWAQSQHSQYARLLSQTL